MARGVSLLHGTNHGLGTDAALRELDAWADDAGKMPDAYAIWASWSKRSDIPLDLIDGLLERGVEPMVYATTTHRGAEGWRLSTWANGQHDEHLSRWAETLVGAFPGQRIIIRVDQEPGATWCPWGADPKGQEGYDLIGHPARYKRALGRIRRTLRTVSPDLRLFYCGNRGTALARYFPGDRRCDYVGFDTYSRRERGDCPRLMDTSIATLRRVSRRPIIIGEFGRMVGLPDRLAWLRTLDDVTGGWMFMYFDMDLRPWGDKDWTMTPAMRRRYVGA